MNTRIMAILSAALIGLCGACSDGSQTQAAAGAEDMPVVAQSAADAVKDPSPATGSMSAYVVPNDSKLIRPLAVGAAAPDFTAMRPDGSVYLFRASALQEKTLIIFYRGGWCPFCNKHLAELRDVVPVLRDAGVTTLFLSADRPDILRSSLKEPDIDYTLLSDAPMAAARKFGIAFKVDDATVEKYKTYGIDLEASSGYTHHQLPAPAVFVIGDGGKIEFSHANADYKVRLSADEVLAAAGI